MNKEGTREVVVDVCLVARLVEQAGRQSEWKEFQLSVFPPTPLHSVCLPKLLPDTPVQWTCVCNALCDILYFYFPASVDEPSIGVRGRVNIGR